MREMRADDAGDGAKPLREPVPGLPQPRRNAAASRAAGAGQRRKLPLRRRGRITGAALPLSPSYSNNSRQPFDADVSLNPEVRRFISRLAHRFCAIFLPLGTNRHLPLGCDKSP
ncbi:protein of unknown function [Azospirillum baldaniorum]|uniref:Uncharacterized protein n=1 Tax=Azospirillum baldaniorum TaxID=1064539 RepID=A0A9P1JRH0_9PROT|nr:protein of unknown function [Azospirillum baldaniorum]